MIPSSWRPSGRLREVADDVWLLQGQPGSCNVFFVRDGDGVLLFDAGARTMTSAVAAAATRLGGLTRIVLDHAHTDHRGTAPALAAPVLCHPERVGQRRSSRRRRGWPVARGRRRGVRVAAPAA